MALVNRRKLRTVEALYGSEDQREARAPLPRNARPSEGPLI